MSTQQPREAIRAKDFLDIDHLLSRRGARLIRDTVRAFVARPGHARTSATGSRRRGSRSELATELGKLGLLGMHLEGYGCAGASATAYGLACMELEAGDSGVRSLVSVQGSLAMFAIQRWGSEEQKQEWLPRMAAGEAIGCFGLTEPDAGSDPGSMRTRARRDGDDWILHGQKMWITNGSVADVAVVWAATDEGVRGFLVPEGRRASPRRTSTRSSRCARRSPPSCCSTTCACPPTPCCREATSLRGPLSCLNEARYGIVWGAAGAARACFEAALDYSHRARPVRQADRRPSRSSSRSSRRWRSRSTARRCSRCTSAA